MANIRDSKRISSTTSCIDEHSQFFYQWMTLSNILYQWMHTARHKAKNWTCLALLWQKRRSLTDGLPLFFSSLFFCSSPFESRIKRRALRSFFQLIWGYYFERTNSLSLSFSLPSFFLSQYRRTSKRRQRGMYVFLIDEQTTRSKKNEWENWPEIERIHIKQVPSSEQTDLYCISFSFFFLSLSHTPIIDKCHFHQQSLAYLKDYFYHWKTTYNKAFFPWF
jgi:hypothetical protein